MIMKMLQFIKAILLSLVFFSPTLLGVGLTRTIGASISNVVEVSSAMPSTGITVTTTTDELNNDGDCSLREAIQAANTDTPADNCSAGNGDDTIYLPPNTYTLTIEGRSEDANITGDLDVTGVLTIDGGSAQTTIIQSGPQAFSGIDRVIGVLNFSKLTIRNIQIRNGLASQGGTPHIDGGGVYVAENSMLIVENCIIAHNWGANSGGIRSAQNTTVTINNSVISNNYSHSAGGGLGSNGLVSIRNTTFDLNTGVLGGGVYASKGSINITNSTLSNNHAITDPMLPTNGGVGGAIINYGKLNISNSTISSNTAILRGGGIQNLGEMYVSNCTIANNESLTGGGVFVTGGIVTVTNTILMANPGGNCYGAIVSGDYNIGSDTTCALTQVHDQVNIDPLLETLADNGGSTWTHALSPRSLAINAGNCSGGAITVDQRGVPRPQRYLCDVGAYEYDGPFVIAEDDKFTVLEDTSLVMTTSGVLSNDWSLSALTATLNTFPANGILSFDVNGSFQYTPATNFSGVDSCVYVASDGITTDTAVVSITVLAVNDAPIAAADSYIALAGTTFTAPAPGVLGNDSDIEGNSLIAVLDTPTMSGLLILNSDGSFVYTPNGGTIGMDSFTYHANDGHATSDQATAEVMVIAPTLVYLPIVVR
jgi:CSLREA domain-containing protein